MQSKKAHRPVDMAKQQAILDAAREEFFDVGYAAASIERIAQAAEVSKVTIYNHYQGKENLFSAVVASQCEMMRFAVDRALGGSDDFRDELIAFGQSMLGFLSSEEILRFDRRLAGEIERYPEMGELFLEAGPHRLRAMLSAAMAEAMERGHIARADPYVAASHLFGIIRGFTEVEWRFGNLENTRLDEARVADAVDRFLRAYAP